MINDKKTIKHQKGFTLVELLIASSIFSFLLAISLAGFMNITNLFRQAATMRALQQDTDEIINEIRDDINSARGVKICRAGEDYINIDNPVENCMEGLEENRATYLNDPEDLINIDSDLLCLKGDREGQDIVYRTELVDNNELIENTPTTVLVKYTNVTHCNLSVTGGVRTPQVITSQRNRIYSLNFSRVHGVEKRGKLEIDSIEIMLDIRQARILEKASSSGARAFTASLYLETSANTRGCYAGTTTCPPAN
ncbi:prepilin-type N-terminal cleavage/methylation domain-containing protein [Candidatus Saccharibacteria bacterium]|nr:prepilin-type N-terminal cleavage/methylation domain-containing protein [Candidatus Saccharibacteria bacterium]MCB9834668.1 prepilin-type N-terminal cleavage/methylation domain-containing protein [Candidatus Nomurabacteria bacterium]